MCSPLAEKSIQLTRSVFSRNTFATRKERNTSSVNFIARRGCRVLALATCAWGHSKISMGGASLRCGIFTVSGRGVVDISFQIFKMAEGEEAISTVCWEEPRAFVWVFTIKIPLHLTRLKAFLLFARWSQTNLQAPVDPFFCPPLIFSRGPFVYIQRGFIRTYVPQPL